MSPCKPILALPLSRKCKGSIVQSAQVSVKSDICVTDEFRCSIEIVRVSVSASHRFVLLELKLVSRLT